MKPHRTLLSYETPKPLGASHYIRACVSAIAYFVVYGFLVAFFRFLLFGKDGDEGFTPLGHVVDWAVSLGIPTCVGILQYFAVLRAPR